MDRVAKLVAAALLALAGVSAHAGYAYPADPAGFTRSGGTGFQGIGYAVNSANDQAFGRVVHQPNGIKVNVPGRPVTMPAAYRFAANAPRVAAGIIFANPALRTGLAIAAWLGVGKLIWDEVNRKWISSEQNTEYEQSDGYKWVAGSGSTYYNTKSEACRAIYPAGVSLSGGGVQLGGYVEGNWCYTDASYSDVVTPKRFQAPLTRYSNPSCPAGWYVTPAGCVQTPPPKNVQDEAEFARRILNPDNQPGWPNVPADWPMPERVPFELPPGTPLPVEQPFINPQPSPNPQHRPLFVPNGDPVPNPNYDPNAQPSPENQPWIQPGVRLNPSPTVNDPFRLDVKPVDRPKPTGDPSTGPESDPEQNPNNPGDKPKPEDPPGLCDLYPDILACVKLDTPEAPDLPTSEKPISITPDGGWGADGGTCPPPRQIMVQGRTIPIPFDLFCMYMSGLYPVVIAMAWLSAAFIVVGAREGS